MGTCNKLWITLSTRAIFCSRLFLDLWICVDKLCKCIVDKLYNVDMLFLDLWICDMCILMRIIEVLKQVMNLWQVVIYESTICVFLDLWTHNRLWFFFFFFFLICSIQTCCVLALFGPFMLFVIKPFLETYFMNQF